MTRNIRALALSLVAAWGLGTAASAQQPAEPQRGDFGEEVQVNEVLLDVLVTDAKGNAILGLGPDDFVVKEDGKPVGLTGVTFYSHNRLVESEQEMAAKGLKVDREPEDRYFVLFFHDQKSAATDVPFLLSQQLEANQRVRDWVGELLPNDWVAVTSYDVKLKVHQDFTRDKQAVIRALGDAMKGKDNENEWPSRTPDKSQGPSLIASLPRGKALLKETTTVYDGLRVVADAAGQTRGRKNLLLFTSGFGRVNNFGQATPDLRYYPAMVQELNDNNVAVYPIDLVGTSRHPLADVMSRLADETGGQYLYHFTNFITPLRQVSEENGGYYLLSYSSQHPAGKSGFQKVDIDTKDPSLRLRTRQGYTYGSATEKSGR
ncbi:MAG TPA: VWA domain-containing protein [Thermoanaerobaculia bacterium]|nr:VWA domain-containing protein [Thermoanaerobaculia bacterium]